jgi:hypothetical protein
MQGLEADLGTEGRGLPNSLPPAHPLASQQAAAAAAAAGGASLTKVNSMRRRSSGIYDGAAGSFTGAWVTHAREHSLKEQLKELQQEKQVRRGRRAGGE